MKANELRIGNYVEVRNKKSRENSWYPWVQIRVTAIGVIAPLAEEFASNREGQEFRPIPLTEEWLEKFGFEIVWDGHAEKWVGDFEYCVNYEEGYLFFGQCDDYSHSIDGINYVHQLQNLYFALTGDELEIK